MQLLNICQYSYDHLISWTSLLWMLSVLFSIDLSLGYFSSNWKKVVSKRKHLFMFCIIDYAILNQIFGYWPTNCLIKFFLTLNIHNEIWLCYRIMIYQSFSLSKVMNKNPHQNSEDKKACEIKRDIIWYIRLHWNWTHTELHP